MEVEKNEFEWATEYRCYRGDVLLSVVLKSGNTLYLWTDEYCQIKNKELEIDLIYSPVFGLRINTQETVESKKILWDIFLPGLKAQPTIENFPRDSETQHLLYCRDIIQ